MGLFSTNKIRKKDMNVNEPVYTMYNFCYYKLWGSCGRDCMVAGFATTYAIKCLSPLTL